MFLYGQTSKGGNVIYNGKLPELLKAEASYQLWLELKSLYPVADGKEHLVDGVVRFKAREMMLLEQIIEGNMRIAAAIAARYAQSLTWIKYDLYSEAMLGLTVAVNNISKLDFKEPGALRGYLRKCIHDYLSKFIANATHGFTITTKQLSRIRKGKDQQFKSMKELTNIRVAVDDDEHEKFANIKTAEEGREHLIDRMERLMKDAGLDDEEYQVMLFYLAGYTNEETARTLGISSGKVQYKKVEAVEKMRYIFFDPSVDLESQTL